MRSFLARTVLVLMYCLGTASLAAAQQATVIHGVRLRNDPSTRNPPVELLSKGASVTVLESNPTKGFYHVRAADGKEGWVGVKYLSVGSTGTAPSAVITPPSGSIGCDQTLWTHVYNPQRLIVKQQCLTVTGTIVDATNGRQSDGVRHEADGDTHGWLKLDPQFASLVNAGNISDEDGNLVFEIVCKFRVTQADAKASCPATYHTPVQIPPVGSHVRIVGTYVQETNHAKWMEIHPVTSITVIP
ncbi:MAG TPA: SH3 domain-containing protein [Candidatus Angelobacter sp.]|nr:SH3 domain-containing protein [Candidatus Angelobacter sp.]